jgi:hypothetical protein
MDKWFLEMQYGLHIYVQEVASCLLWLLAKSTWPFIGFWPNRHGHSLAFGQIDMAIQRNYFGNDVLLYDVQSN